MTEETTRKDPLPAEASGIGGPGASSQPRRTRKAGSGSRSREKVLVNSRYQILEDLGIGSQGELYLAKCVQEVPGGARLREKVVLTKLFCHCSTPEAWTIFDARAKALRKLDHRGIVSCIDHFPWLVGDHSWPTLVTREPNGQTLQARLKEAGCLPWQDVRRIVLDCLEALIHARDKGISPNLTINPDNIFVTGNAGSAIRDFDMTSFVENDSAVTQKANAKIPDYMAAEAYRNGEVDQRSDIYSLGLCAFECLTGRRPQDVAKEFGRSWDDTPEVPDYVFDLPVFWVLSPAVRTVINKAIQTDKSKRFKTLEQMRDAFPDDWHRVLRGTEGKYRLISYIDKGAFGLVFKAERISDGSPVCVKRLLRPRYKEGDLRKEANLLRTSRHDHIVKYVDFVETSGDGHQYLVMEFLEGMPEATLRKRIDKANPGGMDRREVLTLFGHFAEALGYLHNPGKDQRKAIMHGDIRPANLYAPEKRPEECRILDFGIACAMETPACAGDAQGAPDYKAPEVVKDSRSASRADVFSLGVCLYEALTGSLPYPSHDKRQTPDMSRFSDYPELSEVVLKAIALDPKKRYQTADEMLYGILSLDDEMRRRITNQIAVDIRNRFVRRIVRAAAVLAGILVLMAALWFLHRWYTENPDSESGEEQQQHQADRGNTTDDSSDPEEDSWKRKTTSFPPSQSSTPAKPQVSDDEEDSWKRKTTSFPPPQPSPSTPPRSYDQEATRRSEMIQEYERMGEHALAEDLRKSAAK